MLSALFLATVLGCGTDVSVGKTTVDADGDGYISTVDCDDARASVHPEADEVCDGVDDNCDGSVDEAPTDGVTSYPDADSDGRGDPARPVIACETPAGNVAVGDDCDDTLAARYPGAAEECDGLDNDCDSLVDDADPDLSGAPTWYRDADADGYAPDGAASTVSCVAPEGFTATGGDCDDADLAVNPDGTEVCDADDADEDCDGLADDADGSVDASTWSAFYRDHDGDAWGDPERPVTQCDPPAGYVTDDTDCNDAVDTIHPGADEVCDAADADEDCDGLADEADPSVTGESTWYGDADGDDHGDPSSPRIACDEPEGSAWLADDCDDALATIYPGATEHCDGVDEDCDGVIDDGATATVWYADTDGDGYGGTATTSACSAPPGYVSTSTDCDDDAPAIHPAAAETCDGVDQDCDGVMDDGAAPTTWYADTDGDSYGSGTSISACAAPVGYVATSSDCDDDAPDIHPGATETCDGADEDCDGALDEGAIGPDWYADADGDGYGGSSGTTACAAPGGYVASSDDCNDADATVHPDAADACDDGVDADCDGFEAPCPPSGTYSATDRRAIITEPVDSRRLPNDMANVGDVNGDGYEDLLATEEFWSSTATNQGAGLLFLGPLTGRTSTTSADATLLGPLANDRIRRTTFVGDLDGDGLDDLALASYVAGPTTSAAYEGEAWVVLSPPPAGASSLSAADGSYYGGGANMFCGSGLEGVGDLNDDGLADLAIGGGRLGAATDDYLVIVDGPATGTRAVMSAGTVLTGTASDAPAGSVGHAGDLDGDGVDDLIAGVWNDGTYATGAGAVYLQYAPITAGSLATHADRAYTGAGSAVYLGVSMGDVGDLNGDGHTDFYAASGYGAVAYIVLGPPPASGTMASAAAATFAGRFDGDVHPFSSMPDLDGDGADELLVGYQADATYAGSRGLAALFYRPSGTLTVADGDALYVGDTDGDQLGVAPLAIDIDGDGVSAMAVGVTNDDAAATDGGAIWFF